MTEKEKMLAGCIYDPADKVLAERRTLAHNLCTRYNALCEDDPMRVQILQQLVPHLNGAYLQGPIFFDYGENTRFGTNCYANFNLTVLDCAPVTLGDNVFVGCGVSLVTPMHPLLPDERQMYLGPNGLTDREYARPIVIGSNCWLASNVTVCGGVTIGEGCVIGAGSVVTRNIPSGVFAAGSPCRVIRKLSPEDSIYKKHGLFADK